MSKDLDANEDQPWPCPACAFRAPTAPLLAVHVRFVHVDPMFEEEAPSTWRCPSEKCVDEAKVLPNAERFADHLDRHDLPEKIAEHRRQMEAAHQRAVVTRREAARKIRKNRKKSLRTSHEAAVEPPATSDSPERPIDKYFRAGLGKLPDEEVAAALGFHVENVVAMRKALGLPPPRDQRERRGSQ